LPGGETTSDSGEATGKGRGVRRELGFASYVDATEQHGRRSWFFRNLVYQEVLDHHQQ
jgi:hypothetical protein